MSGSNVDYARSTVEKLIEYHVHRQRRWLNIHSTIGTLSGRNNQANTIHHPNVGSMLSHRLYTLAQH